MISDERVGALIGMLSDGSIEFIIQEGATDKDRNDLRALLCELQDWRAERCETCALRHSCRLLFEWWAYLSPDDCDMEDMDNFGCKAWRKVEVGDDG